jgi:[NiFe] hydrogenase assembly HybE family chaperone
MNKLQQISATMEQTFKRILTENMQGIPILNPMIEVQALGFQEWQGRVLGVIITPWLMNLVLLPAEGEDWSQMELGHKQPHEFPSRSYKFMINDIEGIGPCQTYSMCSPMRDFSTHQQAVQVAQDFLDGLMVETKPTEEDLVDEELLGRVMKGEDTSDIDLSQFDKIEPVLAESSGNLNPAEVQVKVEKKLSRRDLLRGNLAG